MKISTLLGFAASSEGRRPSSSFGALSRSSLKSRPCPFALIQDPGRRSFTPIIDDYEKLREILKTSRTVAVVGISPDEDRPSHFVSEVVKRYGFKIYLINPQHEGEEILGERVLGSIKDVPEKIDILDVFRRPEAVFGLAEEAREKGFRTFWLQPGTENEEVISALDREGKTVVFGICIKTCCQLLL